MSEKYIVRLPIKNLDGTIIGYEIMYHGENQAFTSSRESENEYAAADTIYSFLTQNNTKPLKSSLNFMTFTTTLLMKKTPRLFDSSELVIQIDDSVIIHPLSMHFVKQYMQEGYKIAVNEFQFSPRYLGLLDSIDYIKINAENTSDSEMRNIIEIAHSMNKKCIVTNIKQESAFQKAKKLQADALEGPYVADQMKTKVNNSSYLQSNFFRLMVAVTKDEPQIDEIEQLISMDASLSYGLLRMVNSAYFASRSQTTDIHQAVVMLGLEQLKQWIYLLSASVTDNGQGNDSGTEEFLKRSFMRAYFCGELMHYAKDMPISRSEAYMMGMFSTLHHLIDAPLEDILEEIPISEEVKAALLRQEGRAGKLYDLVRSYEMADWNSITALAEELGIPNNVLTNTYFNCIENVNMLWEQMNEAKEQGKNIVASEMPQ